MTVYQKLEKLQKLERELQSWEQTIASGEIMGKGTIDIVKKLTTQIVILKIELGIKIKL